MIERDQLMWNWAFEGAVFRVRGRSGTVTTALEVEVVRKREFCYHERGKMDFQRRPQSGNELSRNHQSKGAPGARLHTRVLYDAFDS